MCEVLGVSRSGYYAWRHRPLSKRAQKDLELAVLIKDIFDRSRKTYGTPRIQVELRKVGHRCSRARIGRLMKQQGLVARATLQHKKRRPTTVDGDFEVPPNRLEQDFEVDGLDVVWVADISYVATCEGWLYLATVMDLCSRRIVGWSMSESLATSFTLDALQMALGRRQPEAGLIHHSDQGCQYASAAYQQLLANWELLCSMSGRGNCYDNAPMESFFGTLKTEVEIDHFKTLNRLNARTKLFDYIEVFYNQQRIHSALDYLSPSEFEASLEVDDEG